MFYSEGYYDSEDYSNPVKFKFNQEIYDRFVIGNYFYNAFSIRTNIVKFLNGTTQKFYTVERKHISDEWLYLTIIHRSHFELSNEYTEYEQFVNHRVIRDESRRALHSQSHSELLMSPLYLILFSIALFGGLYQ